jgi:protein-tyrosine phosphatase
VCLDLIEANKLIVFLEIPLVVVPRLLFEFQVDRPPIKGVVYLSNITVAIPGSQILKEKGIKSVISILDLDELGDVYGPLSALYGADSVVKPIWSDGLDKVVEHEESGVLYYNLRIADVSNPSILLRPKEAGNGMSANDVFCREVAFVEERLKNGGNVLVHCKQGRRRSPTAFLAFLISQGLRLHHAIQLIGSSYTGEDDWADGYRRHRAQWISSLSNFESKFRSLIDAFTENHPQLFKAFQGHTWNEQDQNDLEERRRKQSQEFKKMEQSSNDGTALTLTLQDKKRHSSTNPSNSSHAPPAKKYKIASSSSSMTPSLWANRRKNK